MRGKRNKMTKGNGVEVEEEYEKKEEVEEENRRK